MTPQDFETIGRAIYEDQCARSMGERNKQTWRSRSSPEAFWNSFIHDAMAAHAAILKVSYDQG